MGRETISQASTTHQSEGPTVSGLLQRSQQKPTAEKSVESVDREKDTFTPPTKHFKTSGFKQNFSQIPLKDGPLPGIQAKLTIGQPGDKYEQEADRVAAQVVSMPESYSGGMASPSIQPLHPKLGQPVQRQADMDEDEEMLQAKRTVDAKKAIPNINLHSGDGRPLARPVRNFMEARFNRDFGQVRLHTDGAASRMARDLSAQAFTHKQDIFFRAGQYQPGTNSGKELLAHELTHVVQQTGSKNLDSSHPQRILTSPDLKSPVRARLVTGADTLASGSVNYMPLTRKSYGVDQRPTDKGADISSRSDAPKAQKALPALPTTKSSGDSPVATASTKQLLKTSETDGDSHTQVNANLGQPTAQTGKPIEPTIAKKQAEPANISSQNLSDINAPNPGGILEQLSAIQPTNAIAAYKHAQQSSASALANQTQDVQSTLPEISTPTGIAAKEEKQSQKEGKKAAQKAAISKDTVDIKTAKTLEHKRSVDYKPQVKESPPPRPPSPTKLASSPSADSQSDPALAQSAQNALDTVHLSAGLVETTTHNHPQVELSGETNPAQIDNAQTESDLKVNRAKNSAAKGIRNDFGENRIFPVADGKTLKSDRQLSTVSTQSPEAKEAVVLPEEAAGALNQSLGSPVRSRISEQSDKYKTGKDQFDTERTDARSKADKEISELDENTRQSQLSEQAKAKASVRKSRQTWRADLDNVDQRYQSKATAASQENKSKIVKEKTEGDEKATQQIEAAEKKAEGEKQKAEAAAHKKKKDAKKESGGFFGWVKSKAKALIDGVKAAVNFIYNNLRKAVKAIFDVAKKLVTATIELARKAIVGLIKIYGEILKGLIKVVFSAFPDIAKRMTDAIDLAVSKATSIVNKAAAFLKKAASAVLGFLAKTIDSLLGLVQGLYSGILTVIGMLVNGELQALLKKVDNLIEAAKTAPEQFETAALEELLGGNLDQPLSPQELGAARAAKIMIPSDVQQSNTPKAGNLSMPQAPWTDKNVGVDAVGRNMQLSPELSAQVLQKAGSDGVVMLGQSNDKSRSMDSILAEANKGQQQTAQPQQSSSAAKAIKNPPDGLTAGQRAEIKWALMKDGISKWWSKNWPYVVGGTIGALAGIGAALFFTGGAIAGLIPPIMSIVGPLFAGLTVIQLGGHVRDYVAKAWDGKTKEGGKSLAKGLAAGAIELVSWLTFKAGGGLLKGAKALPGLARKTVSGSANLARRISQGIVRGSKYLIKQGKVLFKGIANSGIGQQFKRLQNLGKELLAHTRFKAFRIRITKRRFTIQGLINPWVDLTGGDFQRVSTISRDSKRARRTRFKQGGRKRIGNEVDIVKRSKRGVDTDIGVGTIVGVRNRPSKAVKQLISNRYNLDIDLVNKLSDKGALEAFIKIASRAETDDVAREIVQTVTNNIDIPGMKRWIKATGPKAHQPNQLLDMKVSLDDAVNLKQQYPDVQIEVFYRRGQELTDPNTIRSVRDKSNVDVVTRDMRREWKRVNKPIEDKSTLLHQIQDARLKFRDAQLTRGLRGKENVGMVDFGNQLTAGGKLSRAEAVTLIKEFLDKDEIAREFLDKLIVRVNGDEIVFLVPRLPTS